MTRSGQRLMSMIGAALTLLDRPAQLRPVLRSLGDRHRGYGVRDAHYAVVGEALLQTLPDGLVAGFTEDVRDAWTSVYRGLAATMIGGAAAEATSGRSLQGMEA